MSLAKILEQSFDAFARLQRIDDYPNQPEIVEWPLTELEKVEMNALTSQANHEAAKIAEAQAQASQYYEAIAAALETGYSVTIIIQPK